MGHFAARTDRQPATAASTQNPPTSCPSVCANRPMELLTWIRKLIADKLEPGTSRQPGFAGENARTEHGLEETHRLSLLTDSGDVRTFDLFDLELTILDEGIKRDLDFYLKTQLASKKKDARTFTLFAQGEGTRTVRVSYVLEAPVWKATYRILLDEGEESSPLIQGWAVVDNTSDEDWQDVGLTLVAGLPVSFTHDLYTPR